MLVQNALHSFYFVMNFVMNFAVFVFKAYLTYIITTLAVVCVKIRIIEKPPLRANVRALQLSDSIFKFIKKINKRMYI
jgi:hypothetical protein